MSRRGIITAVLAMIAAAAFIAAIAIAMVGAEIARLDAPEPTSTFIPAPRVVILRCVEGMDGFECVEEKTTR